MSRDNRNDPTPYAVLCRVRCGRVFLTAAQYAAQMDRPNSLWLCPTCGQDAEWDDECQETNPPEDFTGPDDQAEHDQEAQAYATGDEQAAYEIRPRRQRGIEAKVLEIRDEGTFIPALAVNINPSTEQQRYLMRRVGYPCDGVPNVILTHLTADGGPAWNDPYGWSGRTYPIAHNYIIEHWHELDDGDVIDVQFILGETAAPKRSERG